MKKRIQPEILNGSLTSASGITFVTHAYIESFFLQMKRGSEKPISTNQYGLRILLSFLFKDCLFSSMEAHWAFRSLSSSATTVLTEQKTLHVTETKRSNNNNLTEAKVYYTLIYARHLSCVLAPYLHQALSEDAQSRHLELKHLNKLHLLSSYKLLASSYNLHLKKKKQTNKQIEYFYMVKSCKVSVFRRFLETQFEKFTFDRFLNPIEILVASEVESF